MNTLLLSILLRLLSHDDHAVRESAASVLQTLARDPSVVATLADRLPDADIETRWRLVEICRSGIAGVAFDRAHPAILAALEADHWWEPTVPAEVRPTVLGAIEAFARQDADIGVRQCLLPFRSPDDLGQFVCRCDLELHWDAMFRRVNSFKADVQDVIGISSWSEWLSERLRERKIAPEPGEVVVGVQFAPGSNEWLILVLRPVAGRWRVAAAVAW